MARKPDMRMSDADRRLLNKLNDIFNEISTEYRKNSNKPDGYAVLSESEAEQISLLLSQYIDQSSFVKYSYFIEHLFSSTYNDSALREIYLSERKIRGRSRAMAATHWREFKSRVGIEGEKWQKTVPVLDEDTFIKLEKVLVSSSGISEPFADSVLETVSNNLHYVRSGSSLQNFSSLSAYGIITEIVAKLRSKGKTKRDTRTMSTTQLSALAGLLIDGSAMFTTRDWSAASSYSALASTVVLAFIRD